MLHGIDLVDIERIARLAERTRFLQRVYTADELQQASRYRTTRRHEWLAGRFAAKEATIKALSGVASAIRGKELLVRYVDIEVLTRTDGSPRLALYGRAQELAHVAGVTDIAISITHTGTLAMASVLLH